MKLVAPQRWWTVPAVALPGGVLAALLPELFTYATGVTWAVRVVVPLVVLLAVLAYPRYLAPLAASVVVLVGIAIGRCLRADIAFWTWSPAWWLRELTHPLSLATCFFGLVVGLAVVPLIRRFRRVGIDWAAGACRYCGYAAGRSKVCPECGKPNLHHVI